MSERLTLTYMSGTEDGRVVHLALAGSPSEVIFGRLPSCTVCLSHDPDASRQHSRLALRDGAWWLEDLGSTNGTFLGEFAKSEKIAGSVLVSPGQVFRVGRTRFLLESSDGQEAEAVAQTKAVDRH